MIPAEEGECTSWWSHIHNGARQPLVTVDADKYVATEKLGANCWSTSIFDKKENKWIHRWVWRTYSEAENGHGQVVGFLEGKNERPSQDQTWQNVL